MNFAVEEIQDVVPYYVVMSGCFFAAQLIIIFKEGKLPYILIWLILEFLQYAAAMPLRKVLKNKIVYYLFFMALSTMTGIYLMTIEQQSKQTDDEKMELDIREKYEYFMRTALFYILFACPSTKMFLAYLSAFILFVGILSLHYGDLDDANFVEAFA